MSMRLWNSSEIISKLKLEEGDEYSICEQFSKKINCLEKNQLYKPDISKDVSLARNYIPESLNLHEFCNRENCIESIRCTRLRIQRFQLLTYLREQKAVVEKLVNMYHQETDPKKKLALKGLARIKSSNLKLIEETIGQIIQIYEQIQESSDFLDKMMAFIRKGK